MKRKINNIKKTPYFTEIFVYLLLFTTFFALDMSLKFYAFKYYSYYNMFKIQSILFSTIWSVFFSTSIMLISSKIRSYVYIVMSSLWLFIAFAQLMMLKTKDSFITIYDLSLASEAAAYINFIIPNISKNIILFIIGMFLFSIYTFTKLKINLFKNNNKYRIYLFLCSLFVFVFGWLISISLYTKSDDKFAYYAYEYEYTFYEELSDPIKTLELTGLYHYTFLNIYEYFQSHAGSNKDELAQINEYLIENTIVKEENDYTGLFKNKNLILIQVESLETFNITKNVMPTLYTLMNTGWSFTNYYNHTVGSAGTLNSEFVVQNGLIHLYSFAKHKFNYKNSLPNIFKNNGYTADSFHNNKGIFYNRKSLHETMGFTTHYSLKDLYPDIDIYNDEEMFNINDYGNLIVPNQDGKFYSYVVTISAHGPYSNNYICSTELKDECTEEECFSYLAGKTDNFLTMLLDNLKNKNLLDDTVIILYSDHYSYSYEPTENEKDFYSFYSPKIRNIPFIIWSKDINKKTFSIPLSMSDTAPTILNLFGLDYNPNNYTGIDYFSNNHPRIAYFLNNTWYDGKDVISYAQDDKLLDTYNFVINKIYFNNNIIRNNYFNYQN